MFYCKNVQQQVNVFKKTIINIFSSSSPNKLVTLDDKHLPWMKEKLKEKIEWKDKVYRDYLKMVKAKQTICMYIVL